MILTDNGPLTIRDRLDGASQPLFGRALTEMELLVLDLRSLGYSALQIAHRLGRAESTIKNHSKAVLGKTGAPNMTRAAVLYVEALAPRLNG